MKQMLDLKMLAWLEDNIYCNPAIDDLAQHMAIRVGLCTTGLLPVTHRQYIRLRRLTIAAASLALTRQPIAAIALEPAYDSPQTFPGV